MANKKFSEFTLKTDSANVDFVVGYDGSDNVRIAPSNLSSGGASSLNGLSDVLVDTASLYVGTIPSGLSGNPQGNTTLGISAGLGLTSGANNTIIGNSAGVSNTGSNVVAIGSEAARVNTADQTVSVGYQSGYSQTSGVTNTYVGYRSGYSTTTGRDNAYVGRSAGYSATGSRNSSLGDSAFGGGFGHSGTDNVAFGYRALQQPSGASNYNVAIGSDALRASGTKSNNVAIGYQAGTAVTTGSNNIVIGYQAGFALTTGGGNTLLGYLAGEDLSAGVNNVAIGYEALKSETNHGRNVAIGFGALQTQNAGVHAYNVALGYSAGGSVNTGKQNTFLGGKTGETLTTGENNTVIGYSSTQSAVDVDNEITLGNSSVSALRCAVTSITSLSDERDKSEIKDLQYGLDFIDSLQPREFIWDNRAEITKEYDEEGNATEVEFYSANKGKKDFGFIAQEVQSVDDDTLRLVYDENPDKLELSYGKLVPILVQAIKELKAEVELLKA